MKRQHGILLSWAATMVIVLSACVLPTPAPIATATPAPAASQTPTEPAVPTAAPTEPAVPTAVPTPATEPKIIRIATAYGLELPDPALANPWNEASSAVLQAVYQTLVTYVPDEFATIAPGLAQRWEVSDDYKTLTFDLGQDAHFADGDPVTARDVVFSFERLKNTGGAPAFLAETIASVEAVDDDTVVLKLTQPDSADPAQTRHTGVQRCQRKVLRGQRIRMSWRTRHPTPWC